MTSPRQYGYLLREPDVQGDCLPTAGSRHGLGPQHLQLNDDARIAAILGESASSTASLANKRTGIRAGRRAKMPGVIPSDGRSRDTTCAEMALSRASHSCEPRYLAVVVGQGPAWASPIVKSVCHLIIIDRIGVGVGRVPRRVLRVRLGLRPLGL